MKKLGHLSSFYVPFLSKDLNLSKKVYFLHFCADHSKKSKSVKAIYICEPESSQYTDMVYRGLIYHSWDLSD